MPKIGKIKLGEFSNFTNRITIISQTELQTEKHHQSTDFSKFPNKRKMQFHKHNYKQITNRTKEKEKKKERSKERIKSKRKILKEVKNIYYIL